MSSASVYIVDDDPDMRDSLGWLLKTIGLRSVAFASAEEFVRSGRPEGPCCLILDVRMPVSGGLDLLDHLTKLGIKIPVIFITAYADVPMAVRAMKLGATEFLEKPFNGQDLLEKIQRALKDEHGRLEQRSSQDAALARFEQLTRKEQEVLAMICEGRPNKEIARLLDLTARAVELRRASLMRKLGVSSLPELLRVAIGIPGLHDGSHASNGFTSR